MFNKGGSTTGSLLRKKVKYGVKRRSFDGSDTLTLQIVKYFSQVTLADD